MNGSVPAAEGSADTVRRHHYLWRLAGVIYAVRRVCPAGVHFRSLYGGDYSYGGGYSPGLCWSFT
jgi:hypothetical protein